MSENNNRASTISYELTKESKNERIKRLKNYKWGIGLEHEMQVFHAPPIIPDSKVPITSYIVFDCKPFIERLLKSDTLDPRDREFLQSLPFEPTGRICNGKVVLEKTPVPMPEFVTEKPISSLKTGKRPIEYYVAEMKGKEDRFIALLNKFEIVQKYSDRYGNLMQYPFGVTSYLQYPKSYKHFPYKLSPIRTDYLGSYHITLTLPYLESVPLKKFIKMHQNFANQIQWIEPLLITAFFSSDQSAVGTTEKRIKGSYRVARIGWGNFGGSDIRKFGQGIGRYANIKSYWRDGFEFYDSKKVEACKKLAPALKKVEPGAISGYSSNFRTFGSTDPIRPWHRESGIGMSRGLGVELRIFDHFDSYYFEQLAKFVIYVAENSRVTKSTKYVYDNKAWITALRRIMIDGWKAEIPEEYIQELRNQLGITIRTRSLIAYDVMHAVNEEIFQKNKRGDWTFLMLEKEYLVPPKLSPINRRSWETGLMMKLNRDPKLLEKFNKFTAHLATIKTESDYKEKVKLKGKKVVKQDKYNKQDKSKSTKKSFTEKLFTPPVIVHTAHMLVDDFAPHFFKFFPESSWKNDVIDVIYFLETLGYFDLKYSANGHIFSIAIRGKEIEPFPHFNEDLRIEWTREYFETFAKYAEKTAKLAKDKLMEKSKIKK